MRCALIALRLYAFSYTGVHQRAPRALDIAACCAVALVCTVAQEYMGDFLFDDFQPFFFSKTGFNYKVRAHHCRCHLLRGS